MSSTNRTSVGVYVCTFQRNEALGLLLEALDVAAAAAADIADVGVVIADDNPDGRAVEVARRFEGRFPLGVHYRHVGSRNISIARNAGLEGAMDLGEWVAMTDDDCEPSPGWIVELLHTQRRFDADAVTGPMRLRPPANAPRWLLEQPFLESGVFHEHDGTTLEMAATNNSMIRSRFLRDHPEIRFDPSLGTLGGEDMVFFRQAHAAGLQVRYAANAAVWANEDPWRSTFRYRLRIHLWLGNTEAVTNLRVGSATRWRLLMRGAKRMVEAGLRPIRRVLGRQRPQLRYAMAQALVGVGLVLGALGIELDHH